MSKASHTIALFIWFRVLFNARYYYPVLGIYFIDLGLSLEQYGLLNVVWAVTIVCLEVPSGAVADQLGRKRMVVLASALMVVEMALMAFAPSGNPTLLFVFLMLNRILSGAAEASASGADEALAFGALKSEGRESEWPAVLARLVRWQSIAFFAAMLIGSTLYDAALLRSIAGALGIEAAWLTPQVTCRFPVYLTLINAVFALAAALAMHEPPRSSIREPVTLASTLRRTLAAALWIWRSPKALLLILAGLTLDSVLRLFLTFNSNYYRLIGLPEASFGVLGSLFALLGFAAAPFAQHLVRKHHAVTNFLLVAVLAFSGLLGAAMATGFAGLWITVPIGIAWSCLTFFLSHYLNEIVPEEERATVLSFRGLALNIGYGGMGLLFATLTRWLSHRPGSPGSTDAVFAQALWWLPGGFLAFLAMLALAAQLIRRRSRRAEPGSPAGV